VNSVLAELGRATGRGRDGVSFEDLFHAVPAGAFHNDPSMTWALGDISGLVGDPSLVIRTNVGNDPFNIAWAAMHEITHGGPKSGDWYTHFEMASAAYKVGGSMGILSKLENTNSKGKTPNPNEAAAATPFERRVINNDNSLLFQNLLEIACPKPK